MCHRYGSVALLKPHPLTNPILSKTRMSVRATSLGVTSFDFNTSSTFITWAFTRSEAVCKRLVFELEHLDVVRVGQHVRPVVRLSLIHI